MEVKDIFIGRKFIIGKVESFELDHTKVRAPYIRLVAVEEDKKNDKVNSFDLRLVQPSKNAIPTRGLHTVEHLLTGLLRDHIGDYTDCSPFSCRTGSHLLVWDTPSTTDVARALKEALKEIRDNIQWEGVPGTTIEPCENCRDHSLFSVKQWSGNILERGISDDPSERNVVE